jgi:hypothetical protein
LFFLVVVFEKIRPRGKRRVTDHVMFPLSFKEEEEDKERTFLPLEVDDVNAATEAQNP